MSTRLDATYPATPAGIARLRREVVAAARECGFSGGRLADIRLAASEAATNSVVHGYRHGPGEIRATVRTGRRELVLVIADDGLGMVPRHDSPGLGLGVPMMTSVADRLEVVSEGQGCEIHLSFRLP